jgi:hypothetical protein
MRPNDPNHVKILVDAHVESLRGGRRRSLTRRSPRSN